MNEELIYGLFNLLIKMNFLHREKKTLIQREREREGERKFSGSKRWGNNEWKVQ